MPAQGPPQKPELNEVGFQQLLAAAYVLQQHMQAAEAQTDRAKPDAVHGLSEMVEVQRVVRERQMGFDACADLAAERLLRLTDADGVAIASMEGDVVKYVAAAGTAADDAGTLAPIDANLSSACIHSGQLVHTSVIEQDERFLPELCQKKRTQAVAAIPVQFEGKVQAVLELRSSAPHTFDEQDLQLSQFMCGLLAECLAREAEAELRQAIAAERATMLRALGSLKPQLERLAGAEEISTDPLMEVSGDEEEGQSAIFTKSEDRENVPLAEAHQPAPDRQLCEGCGSGFEVHERYCGTCGAPRRPKKSDGLQSKWAMLWHMQKGADQRGVPKAGAIERAAEDGPTTGPLLPPVGPEPKGKTLPKNADEDLPLALQEMVQGISEESREGLVQSADIQAAVALLPEAFDKEGAAGLGPYAVLERNTDTGNSGRAKALAHAISHEIAPAKGPSAHKVTNAPALLWPDSARKMRAWLESLEKRHSVWGGPLQQWRMYRGPIYITVASAIFLTVLLLPGGPQNSRGLNNSAAGGHRTKLTFFESILVDLGIAVPPPAPSSKEGGDPNTQVWVDLHTALYYCPGSELYGKTEGGKFVTQRDAQLDQFEPAFRKACN